MASVRICGNKGYPVRKPAYTDDIYDPAKVHNEVQYLSYYLKNRRAAAENENRAPKLDSGMRWKVCWFFFIIFFPNFPLYTSSNKHLYVLFICHDMVHSTWYSNIKKKNTQDTLK